jgi:hypothetical protein
MRSARETSSAKPAAAEPAVQSPNGLTDQDRLSELQQSAGNQAMLRLLGAGPVQLKHTGLSIQRAAREGSPDSQPSTETEPAAPTKSAPALIVEDDAKDLSAGQMRKTEFISQLRTAASSAAEQALAGTMWSAMGCPYIDKWLDHYSKQSSIHLERALRKYVPESAGIRSAQEYLPPVTQKLKRGIEQWRATGEKPDVPEDLAGASPEMPGMTLSGLAGGLLSAAGSAISGVVSGVGSAIAGVGRMLFKGKEGHEPGSEADDPQTVRSELGAGQPLEGGVKQRMQSAFGADFAGVRVHSDFAAQEASDRLDARAFTIGSDIAFGPGEYQPGTPVGDALIAHELAHVVQQQSSDVPGAPSTKSDALSSALEEEADVSAVGAVVSTWGAAKTGLGNLSRQSLPRLRSGLKLQRCSDKKYSKSDLQKKVDGGTTVADLLAFIKGLKADEQKQALKDLEALRIDYVDRNVSPAAVSVMEQTLQNLYREVGQTQAPGKTSPERGYAATGTAVPAELLAGTHTLTAAEKTEATGVLTVAPGTGPLPEFKPDIGANHYEARIKARVKDWIDEKTAELVTGKGTVEHGQASKTFKMDRFEEIGNAAREQTDKVFGSYARGPKFKEGVNLNDRFVEQKASQAALDFAGKKQQAKDLVAYMLTDDAEILQINREHGAVPGRTTAPSSGGDAEATILERIQKGFASSHRDKLLAIDRNWEASQNEGKVSIQRFKKGSDDENRKMFWDYFQIMIHEYVHSLENQDYHNYADTTFHYGSEQYNALVEGMASVLAEIAWTNIKSHVSEQALRDQVEGTALSGAAFDPANVPEMNQRRYASFDQAMKLVNKVGIQNVYAAFFLGKIQLIGAP